MLGLRPARVHGLLFPARRDDVGRARAASTRRKSTAISVPRSPAQALPLQVAPRFLFLSRRLSRRPSFPQLCSDSPPPLVTTHPHQNRRAATAEAPAD